MRPKLSWLRRLGAQYWLCRLGARHEKGERVPRKVAWKVFGYASPQAYRLWRDQRIRHETMERPRRTKAIFSRVSGFSRVWLEAQPLGYRLRIVGGRCLDDRPYVVKYGDTLWSVAREMSGSDDPAKERLLMQANPAIARDTWWTPGTVIYIPATWPLWRGHDYWPADREALRDWIRGPGPGEPCTPPGSTVEVFATTVCLSCGHPPCPWCLIRGPGHFERLDTETEWIGWCDRDMADSLGSHECCEGICFYSQRPLFYRIDSDGRKKALTPNPFE